MNEDTSYDYNPKSELCYYVSKKQSNNQLIIVYQWLCDMNILYSNTTIWSNIKNKLKRRWLIELHKI